MNHFLNLCHHFGGMDRCPLPTQGLDLTCAVDVYMEYPHCVQHRWESAPVDPIGLVRIQVTGGIAAIVSRIACL